MTAKKYFIKTYGCQMNVYDSIRMGDVLRGEGYEESASAEGSDLIILNTCHIREKAAEKVYSDIGRLAKLKKRGAENGKTVKIAVAGCVAQAEGEEIVARAPVVDLVFGPQRYHHLPEHLKALQTKKRIVDVEDTTEDKFQSLPKNQSQKVSAFLTVQEGCDKFCTFCVVPYTRGMEVSRPVGDVLQEAKTLINQGVQEITLLGQNVNAYHGCDEKGRPITLAELIYKLADLDIKRIRYTTSHPNDMQEDLINAHRDCEKLTPYLHLPIQSGSDKILKAMNRKHTAAFYLEILEKVRSVRPDIALSSDFIVGFPGETEEDFQATLNVVEKVGYASAYAFKYSPRPGTPGALLETQVPEDVKTERLHRLQEALFRQAKRFNQQTVGKTFDLLIDRTGRKDKQFMGRSPWGQSTLIEGAFSLGDLHAVKAIEATQSALKAELA